MALTLMAREQDHGEDIYLTIAGVEVVLHVVAAHNRRAVLSFTAPQTVRIERAAVRAKRLAVAAAALQPSEKQEKAKT